jgi:hypothetical protein
MNVVIQRDNKTRNLRKEKVQLIIYRTETVQTLVLKNKKPLKINRLTRINVHSIDLFSNQTIDIFKKLAAQNLY